MAVGTADGSQAIAIAQLCIPILCARKHNLAAVDDLDSREQVHIYIYARRRFPATAHAGFSTGRFGVVDRCDAALRQDIVQYGIQIQFAGSHAVVDELRYAEDVEVAIKRRYLASRNQQDTIEV